MTAHGTGATERGLAATIDQLAADVERAAAALDGHVVHTPLVPAPHWSAQLGADVRWKLENVQHTGSFKVRGASNALLQMPEAQRGRGVVGASSGNHGLGLAHAANQLHLPVTVFVPETTPPDKRAMLQQRGAEVVVHGADCVDTEAEAQRFAGAHGRAYVSPYNDATVIAGQGTIARELLADWPEVEVVYVALGGGGLLAGMAAWGRVHAPGVEWVGCSPAASPAMAACVRAGQQVEVPCGPTWSDSTAGGVEPGAITVPLCCELVDRLVDVDESAITAAMRTSLRQQHLLIEGAAAVAVAACERDTELRGRRAAVLICGGNLPFALLQRLLAS